MKNSKLNGEIHPLLKGPLEDSYNSAAQLQNDYIKALEGVVEVTKKYEWDSDLWCHVCWVEEADGHLENCELAHALKRLEEVKNQLPKHHHCSCVGGEGMKTGECDSCGIEDIAVGSHKSPSGDGENWICYVCANTSCGNAFYFPSSYDGVLYRTLAQLTNIILQAIERKK